MAVARLDRLLRRRHPGPGEADDALLARFVAARDEAAFAELVRRHGPMVLAVCRRVLCDHHDAEDAFQAAFLVLARRAHSLTPRRTVGDWLFGVARRTALAARRAAARRRRHEAMTPPRADPPPGDLAELKAVVDEEVARLPARYRSVLVLSDLADKDRRQVAAELGIPEGTVASRLARGRTLLSARLTRRGWGPAGALAALAGPAVLPAGAEAEVVRAAVGFVTGTAAGIASGRLLAERVVRAMWWKKVAVAVAGIGLAVGAGVAGLSTAGEPGDSSPAPKSGGYAVTAAGDSAVLLDTATGDAWVLNRPAGGEPTWVPVKRPPRPAPGGVAKSAPKEAAPATPPKAEKKAEPPAEILGLLALAADRTFRVHPRIGGVVAQVGVRVGQEVKAGQVLAVLDDTDAKLAVDAALADLVRVQADLPTGKQDPKPGWQREVNRAEAAVRRAEVEVARAKANLAATRLLAPADGVVVEKAAGLGDVVQPTGPPAFVVADVRSLEASVNVPEADANAGRVAVGQRCRVRLMGAPGTEYPGQVVRVAGSVDPSTRTVVVGVRLVLTSGAAPPRPGTSVVVKFSAD